MSHGTLRPVDVDSTVEVAALLDLMVAVQRRDDFPEPWTANRLDDIFAKPFFDPALDLVVAADNAGDLVGWAHVWHRPSGVIRERVLVYGGVRPDHRGRGIGPRLLDWAEARGRQRLEACDPSLEKWLLVDALEHQSDRRRLHERCGFVEARWFVEMKRPLDGRDDRVELESAAGISIVPWTDGHSGGVRDVNAEAFGDHWGSTPISADDWAGLLADAETRLDLSFVALDGDRIVAYALNDVYPEADPPGEQIAWVASLGTLRSHRRRGIAGQLLEHSHRAFVRAGFTHAMLDVDANSPSGAGAIYERHGYSAQRRVVVSMKLL